MIKIVLCLVLFFLLLFIGWRLLSKRYVLPCPAFLGWMVEIDNPFAKACHASSLLKFLDIKSGMKVLDAGAGSGRFTLPAARMLQVDGEIFAVDLQQGMLNKIKAKAEREGLHKIKYFQASLGTGSLPKNYFDRANMATVIGEIPNQKLALNEIFNSLKSGGKLAISEMIFDPHFQTQKHISRLARECGFDASSIYGYKLAYTIILTKP